MKKPDKMEPESAVVLSTKTEGGIQAIRRSGGVCVMARGQVE